MTNKKKHEKNESRVKGIEQKKTDMRCYMLHNA